MLHQDVKSELSQAELTSFGCTDTVHSALLIHLNEGMCLMQLEPAPQGAAEKRTQPQEALEI